MSQYEYLPEAICPECGRGGSVSRFARRETVDVRGLEFEVEKILRHCEACGAEFETRSTKPELHVEICSECHPFYTGKQKLVDTGGRVERFQRRLEKAGGARRG